MASTTAPTALSTAVVTAFFLADAALPPAGFENRFYPLPGYSGSRVLEHNQTGRFSDYAEVQWPQAVAVDREDRVWIVDRVYHTVQLMEPATRYVPWPALFSAYAGDRGRGGHFDGSRQQALFDSPSGLAMAYIDAMGGGLHLVIFVADTNNHCVRRLNFTTGRTATIVGSPRMAGLRDGPGFEARLRYPMSLGADSSGSNLFVLDNVRHIRHVDLTGITAVMTTLASGACRAVSRMPIVVSAVVRTVGCHKDWILAKCSAGGGCEQVEAYTSSPICKGHYATCSPRAHPALADRHSKHLLPKPTISREPSAAS